MKYLSLFTGIGGFELGIQNAYEANNSHAHREVQGGWEVFAEGEAAVRSGNSASSGDVLLTAPVCVGYSEIDKYATQIYQRHFPEHHNFGDITKINEHELPDFDLLCGGFPCQAFSIAGKRGGFTDTRGTLFFDIARILKAKQPRLLLLENVKGLLSHDEGRTFATIISTLDELGYDLQWQVLNSKDFGVPQNRERVLIVGHLRGTSRPQVFPIGESNRDAVQGNREGQERIADTLTTRYASRNGRGTHISVGTLRTHKDGNGFREVKSGLAPTIPARAREDGSGQPVLLEGARVRRLTPTECERLQGFPDGWTEGVSDTQRYKCLGNAVTTNVIEAVVSRMI